MEKDVRAITRGGLGLALSLLLIAAMLLAAACGDDDTEATAGPTPTSSSTATTAGTTGPGRQPEARVVTIGVVQSLTGAGSVYGKTVVEGIELAVEHLNEDASDSGIRLETVVVDDRSDVEGARAAFASLVARDVDAIVGPTLSNVAPDAHRVAQEAGIPVLGATTTAVGITDTGDYIFRIALSEAVVVPATIARVVRQHSLGHAVLILDSSDAFSRSSADAMRAGLTAEGETPLAEVDLAKEDIATALIALEGRSIDAFLITPLVNTSALALQVIRGAGFHQIVIGGNSFNTPDIVRLTGVGVEGAYVGAAWNPGLRTPASEAFVEAYNEAYGQAPDQFAAQGYASVQLLADAVSREDSTEHAAVRDALAATRDLDTVLGVLSISRDREAMHAPVVQQYKNGQLVVIE